MVYSLIGADSPLFPLPDITRSRGVGTVGVLIQSNYDVTGHCRHCMHSARVDLVAIGHRHGHATPLEKIETLIACSPCRAAGRRSRVSITVSSTGWNASWVGR